MRVVICCKHWPHARVGANELRCLREQMQAVHATAGELITCGEVSEELLARDTAPVAAGRRTRAARAHRALREDAALNRAHGGAR